MARFAKVVNSRVINIVCSDQKHINMKKDKDFYIEDKRNKDNPAQIGGLYNATYDVFIPIQTHASWILNETTFKWEAPIPKPDDGKKYYWNEPTTSWEEWIEKIFV